MTGFAAPARSMATAAPGDRLHIRRFRFGIVRDRCAELGIREGDVFRCLRITAAEVVVAFPEGHTAALELDYARFVEVAEAAPGPARRPDPGPARRPDPGPARRPAAGPTEPGRRARPRRRKPI